MNRPNVAVIGGGVMGETVMSSILSSGWQPSEVVVAERSEARAADLATRYGVAVTASVAEAVGQAGVVLVAVKPGDVEAVLAAMSSHLAPGTLVVTVAAGLPLAFYESHLPDGVAVVRVMPNTPAVVGAGVASVSGGSHTTEAEMELVERMLAATGTVVRLPEKLVDAVGALSGSGPAYVFYVLDALAEAGVMVGLPRDLSQRLALETMAGACALVRESGEHPVVLRERVSSPGGTTVAALRELDAAGVRAAFIDAVGAAMRRTEELAAQV